MRNGCLTTCFEKAHVELENPKKKKKKKKKKGKIYHFTVVYMHYFISVFKIDANMFTF